MPARNVVFILTDQQKYRTLGCTGAPEARTPHLDALASSGLNFSNFFTASPVCSPSRASIFTGRHITDHGLWCNGCHLPGHVRTVAHDFRDAGFQTAAFGKHHLDPLITRTAKPSSHGFDRWDIGEGDQQLIDDDYFQWLRSHHPDEFVAYINEMFTGGHVCPYTSALPEELHLSRWCVDRASGWLEHDRDADRPFFMYVGFFDPHHAFNPVEPFASMFEGVDVPMPAFDANEYDTKPAQYRHFHEQVRRTTTTPELIKPIIRAYHAMMAHVDACIGRLLDTLDRLGLRESTSIVFSSDHGEWLGEHGLLWKGPFLHDELLHVPMIIAPGDAKSRAPRTVDALASAIDIRPTLLALAGADAPADLGPDARPLADAALNPFPQGQRDAVFAEWEQHRDTPCRSQRCVRTAEAKLVYYAHSDGGELYDLESDPGEFRNLYHDPTAARLKGELMERLSRQYLGRRPTNPYRGGW